MYYEIMNLVNYLDLHGPSVSQWLERPTSIWEVTGSIPVGDSDFGLSPRQLTNKHLILIIKTKVFSTSDEFHQ